MNDREAFESYLSIVSELLGCAPPNSAVALEQRIRTTVSPSVQAVRFALHQEVSKAERALQRKWIDRISIEKILSLSPRFAKCIRGYREGTVSLKQYIEFIFTIIVFDDDFFAETIASWIAVASHERIVHRLQPLLSSNTISPQRVEKEYERLQKEIAFESSESDGEVLATAALEPIIIDTQEGSFLFSVFVHVLESDTKTYTLSFDPLISLTPHVVTGRTFLPWDHAQKGMVARFAFPSSLHPSFDSKYTAHIPLFFFAEPTAIPIRVGVQQDIHMHPDLFLENLDSSTDLFATFRRTPQGIEARAVHPDLSLTLFTQKSSIKSGL